jgi:uncharacterized protein with NRDE domain
MCTVTFVPVRGNFFLTSNRDEKATRLRATFPALYRYNECNLIFPKDGLAGGTWTALKENGNAAVLLNGAFARHVPGPSYRKSRGIVFLEIIASKQPLKAVSTVNLQSIAPFTLILLEEDRLYEVKWDGTEHHCRQLSVNRAYIWSSVTLYDDWIIKKREHWFASFLDRNPQPTQQDILNFHRFSGEGDSNNDLLMNRNGVYATVSITSIQLNPDRGVMKYLDLKTNETSEIKIGLLNIPEPT